ncbi:MAG: methyl-accepting chemotaxis protein [Pseudomonadota bacterium]
MKDRTIRQRILASFVVILTLMVIMGGMVFMHLESIKKEAKDVQHDSMLQVFLSAHLLASVLDGYALVQSHALTRNSPDKQKLELHIRANASQQDNFIQQYQATIVTAGGRAAFEKVKAGLEPFRRAQDRVLKVSLSGDGAAIDAALANELNPEFQRTRSALDALAVASQQQNDHSMQEITGAVGEAKTEILIGLAVAILVACACGYLLLRAITRPLEQLVGALNVVRQGDFTQRLMLDRRDEFGLVAEGFNRMLDELAALVGQVQKSGIQVTTSVAEVAATAKQQQATANEIAATTAEIGATSKEISATSKELVKTMGEVSAVAEQSAGLASNGQAGLSQMEETMRHVMEAGGSISAKLTVLNEKASNINQVITTITKVADQTNLLSLNAAIEAEKAGEHGRGFSVVATEIRRLADQTGVATYDIEQTVKEIQSAVSASVMGMDKFSEEVRRGMQEIQRIGDQLSQIIHQVQTLAPRFEMVNEGMRAQVTGAEQITEALVELNEAAQQTVESLRQSTMAMDELNQVAHSLRGGVSRFKLNN